MNRTSRLVLVVGLLVLCAATSAFAAPSAARRSLAKILPAVNLDNVALNDAIEFLRDVSGANLHVNWGALEAAGIGKDAQVNVKLRNVPLRKVLNLVLNDAGTGSALTFYIDQGVIEITTRELADKELFTKVYPIDDLIVEVPDFAGPNLNITSANTGGGGGGGGGRGGGGGGGGGGTGIFDSSSGGGSGSNREEKNMTRNERAQAVIDTITATIQPDIWQINGGTAAIRFLNGSLIVTAPRSAHEALGGPVD